MKAFLLGAGNGTRLRPLTERTPKCLLQIQGVPLLQIWLQWCESAGVDEVLINTHAHAGAVRDFVSRCDKGELQIHIFHEPELLGSAGTIAANRSWVAADPHFWILYADVLTNVDPRPLLNVHSSRGLPVTIGVYRVPDPARCGIVNVDGRGIVTRFVEKPANPTSNLAFSGIMLASTQIFDTIPEKRPADIGSDLLPTLVGQMGACEITDFLIDIGTLANYESVQTTWPGLRAGVEFSLARIA